jgi:carboxypeptidase C (cathepsin A)
MFFEYASKDGETIDTIKGDTPVLIWLNGGPGSSSQLGAWSEIGPFAVTSEY